MDEQAQANVTGLMQNQVTGGSRNSHYASQSNKKTQRSPTRSKSPGRSFSRLSKSPEQAHSSWDEQRIQKLEGMLSRLTSAQNGLGPFANEVAF